MLGDGLLAERRAGRAVGARAKPSWGSELREADPGGPSPRKRPSRDGRPGAGAVSPGSAPGSGARVSVVAELLVPFWETGHRSRTG